MNHRLAAFLLAGACCSAHVAAAPPAPAYAGQDGRDIKALSPEDVSGYLSGKGMGFAKAAELNGFPGPAHVLELARPLGLTPEQRARTEALFSSMEARAIGFGRSLVDRERALDRLFATKSVTPDLLNRTLAEIGLLQAQVRAAHLEAHLAQLEILTPEQTARYASLRGYGSTGAHGTPGAHGGRHKH